MLISVWSLGKFFKSGKPLYKIFSVAKLLTDLHTPGVCCQKEYRHGWILDGCLLSKVQLTSCQIPPRLGFSFSSRCILTFMSVNMSHHDRARLSLQMCTRLLIFYNTPSIFYSVSLQRAKVSHPEDTRPRCRSGTSAPGSQPPRSPSSRRWDHSLEKWNRMKWNETEKWRRNLLHHVLLIQTTNLLFVLILMFLLFLMLRNSLPRLRLTHSSQKVTLIVFFV